MSIYVFYAHMYIYAYNYIVMDPGCFQRIIYGIIAQCLICCGCFEQPENSLCQTIDCTFVWVHACSLYFGMAWSTMHRCQWMSVVFMSVSFAPTVPVVRKKNGPSCLVLMSFCGGSLERSFCGGSLERSFCGGSLEYLSRPAHVTVRTSLDARTNICINQLVDERAAKLTRAWRLAATSSMYTDVFEARIVLQVHVRQMPNHCEVAGSCAMNSV